MTTSSPELLVILERLDRLERQNRWLQRAGLAILVLVGSVFLGCIAAQRPAKPTAITETLEAQRFVLKNARGEIRAMLSVNIDGQPDLSFWDAQDHLRASLGVWAGEPAVNLLDAQGKRQASLYGGTDGPSLEITDAAGFKAVIGTTDLQRISTGEAHKTSAASVVLFGKDGKVIWRVP